MIAPAQGMNTEALLKLPELHQIDGQRFLILRGVGGRETLATQLRARGAHVDYAECYRRVEPILDATARHGSAWVPAAVACWWSTTIEPCVMCWRACCESSGTTR